MGLPDGQGTRSLHQPVLLDGADVSTHPGPHRHDLHISHMCSSSHTRTPRPRDTHEPRAGHIDPRSLTDTVMDVPHIPVDTSLQRRSRDTHILTSRCSLSIPRHQAPTHMLPKHTQTCSDLDTHVSTGTFILSNTDINTHALLHSRINKQGHTHTDTNHTSGTHS